MKKTLLFALIAMCWSVTAWGGDDYKRVIHLKVGNQYMEVYEDAEPVNSAVLRARRTGKIADGDNVIRITKKVADPTAPEGFRMEETFEAKPVAARQTAIKRTPTADGEEFVATTAEGIEMKFTVISMTAGTCRVGTISENPSSWGSGNACIPTNTEGVVTIPSQVEGLTVTKISGAAFYGCSKITKVTIPSTVISIDDFAFSDTKCMESLYIPATVLELSNFSLRSATGRRSFIVDPDNPIYDSRDNCNAVIETKTNVLLFGCSTTVIPASINDISSAFYGCDDLDHIYIPANLTSMGSQAFDYITGLNTIEVDANNTVFDSRNNCNAIIRTASNSLIWGSNSTVIPATVTAINYNAFTERRISNGFTIPEGITSIGSSAFRYSSNMKEITIPSTVQSIGSSAFEAWGLYDVYTNITKPFDIPEDVFNQDTYQNGTLHVPDNTKGLYKSCIGWRNFQTIDGTGDDTPVELKDGDTFVETINDGIQMTFTVLSAENKICAVGKKNVTSGERTAIRWDASGVVIIPEKVMGFTVQEIAGDAFKGCHYITSVKMPNTVVYISDFAFSNCRNLNSITIPASVNYISSYAFADNNFEQMVVDGGNTVYESINSNAIIIKSTHELYAGCKKTVIPASVTKLGITAFYGCSGLEEIFIPSNVKEMGSQTFAYCSEIMSIKVDPENTVYEDRDCNAIIEKATNKLLWASNRTIIPNSVKIIGDQSFTSRLFQTIYIPEGTTEIESYAFWSCYKLGVVTLPSTLTTIGKNAFNYTSKLAVITSSIATPFVIAENTFYSSTYTNGKLNIPAGTTALYQAQPAWNKFSNMVERGENIEQGDSSGDGVIDAGDVTTLVEWFTGNPPVNLDPLAADANGDGVVDVSDILYIINLLLGKP